MSRIDLQVPFDEKDEARRLGARWDPRRRIWYVAAGVDPAPLQKWCPRPPTPNIRSPRYFLAATTRDCWRCLAMTRVVAILLPEEHEDLHVEDDPADDHWQIAGRPVVLSYVACLTETAAARLRPMAPHYRMDFSQTTGTSYWMNHCEHCTAKLGDYETVCEYGAGFSPRTTEQARAIDLEEIAEPFATSCGGFNYIEWFADAQHPNPSSSHSSAGHGGYFSVRTIIKRRS